MIKHYCNDNNINILEIGVFKGEFLNYIVDNCSYSNVEGVDLFEGMFGSCDHNGNNMITANLNEEFKLLSEKYKDNENVNVYKSHSTPYLESQKDDKYHIIYIDADHSYQTVKQDLLSSFPKIKDGGYLMGHDYDLNKEKCKLNHNFGTKKAVEEFCLEYKQEIESLAMDGCISFCIKVNKSK